MLCEAITPLLVAIWDEQKYLAADGVALPSSKSQQRQSESKSISQFDAKKLSKSLAEARFHRYLRMVLYVQQVMGDNAKRK